MRWFCMFGEACKPLHSQGASSRSQGTPNLSCQESVDHREMATSCSKMKSLNFLTEKQHLVLWKCWKKLGRKLYFRSCRLPAPSKQATRGTVVADARMLQRQLCRYAPILNRSGSSCAFARSRHSTVRAFPECSGGDVAGRLYLCIFETTRALQGCQEQR